MKYLLLIAVCLGIGIICSSQDAVAKQETMHCLEAPPKCGAGRYAQCVCTGNVSKDCLWVCLQ